MIILGVFGSVLLYSSFHMSLEEELKHISQEVGMFSYALNSSLMALPAEYEAIDYAVAQIGNTIVKSGAEPNEIVRIYNKDETEIYTNKNDFITSSDKEDFKKSQAHYEIISVDEKKYLQTFSVINSERGKYFLEISRDISSIYENREGLYRQYIFITAVGIMLSAILSLFFTMSFTKPLLILSKATRSFAGGDYGKRVDIKGDDEIATLVEDFNEMADRLTENMRKLEYQAKVQEEFTAAFAHELKTPLTSIVGYSDMLRTMELSAEDVQMCANYIFNQGSRLEKLSYKLLELVGIDKGKINCKQIKVKMLANKAAKIMDNILKEKNIDLNVLVDDGQIYGDEDLLISLICNLLDNSRKACNKNGKIILRGVCQEELYVIKVQDNGCGISADDVDKVKEAFYMVDKSRARKDGGAGIGMALCEKIVSLHNAEWQIYSKIGEGTNVEISFPLK